MSNQQQLSRIEELKQLRKQIELTNKSIREKKTTCKENIKKLDAQVKSEEATLSQYDIMINRNQVQFNEAGKELAELTGETILDL